MERAATFDVFLSHNGDDKPAVQHIGRRPREAGLKPWLDKWELLAGDRWQDQLAVLLPGVPDPFDQTTLPPFLGSRSWVDYRPGLDDPDAFQSLINTSMDSVARLTNVERHDILTKIN